jgi:PKD repeat protein
MRLFACLFCLQTAILAAQSPTPISGIINRYAVVSSIDTCSGRLTVADTTGFRAGDAVLLIQMQGANIFSDNNFLYGVVANMNWAGRYERAVLDSVGADALFVQKRLVYAFSLPGGLQVVRIAQFVDAVVVDTLKPKHWDGTTGGVLALEVSGTLTLDAPIVADGAGFRGGASYVVANNNCNWLVPETNYTYALGNWRGARRGEGIALSETGKELGRGPQANGGGGGNDHNSGGGGGGNVADGGRGGDNDEPSLFGCDGYYPGIGGYAPFATANRMFLGGGGGAGHANNLLQSTGGSGGGIVFLKVGNINGSSPIISARGSDAGNSLSDGAGGGGAGGTIWLDIENSMPELLVVVNGGQGGNANNNGDNRCAGPGGGGAAGRILTNAQFGSFNYAPGNAGLSINSSNACNNTPNGAEPGETGLPQALPTLPQGSEDYALPDIVSAPQPDSVCVGATAVFGVAANLGGWDFQWQINDGTGWQDIQNTSQFIGNQTDTLLVPAVSLAQNGLRFRCRILRAGCYETVSTEAALAVWEAPTAAFSASADGFTVYFDNQSAAASGYFWDFGDGGASTEISPQHDYAAEGNYTVTLYAISACDTTVTTQSVSILLPPTANFTAPDNLAACGFAVVSFENQSLGAAASFQWLFPAGTPEVSSDTSPTVTYLLSGNYAATLVVTNAAGSDTLTQTFAVNLTQLPSASFSFLIQNAGNVQFTSQTPNATNLLWDFGDGTLSAQPNPAHTFAEGNYVVTLTAWNTCDTVSATQPLGLFFPPAAIFSVADTTLGCGTAQVAFENFSSENSAAFAWQFPGGSPEVSAAENPSVTYTQSGVYTVQLIASNGAGADTLAQAFVVQVLAAPAADFDWAVLGAGVVQFTNLSQSATTYTWDFGDGSPQVLAFDVTHAYAASGAYTVTLVASGPCGASVFQRTIEIVVPSVGATEAARWGGLRLFPNPTADVLMLDWSATDTQVFEIQLFDAAGHLLFSAQPAAEEKTHTRSLGVFPPGVYQLRVRLAGGVVSRAVLRG